VARAVAGGGSQTGFLNVKFAEITQEIPPGPAWIFSGNGFSACVHGHLL
jgi:hypothetical protein